MHRKENIKRISGFIGKLGILFCVLKYVFILEFIMMRSQRYFDSVQTSLDYLWLQLPQLPPQDEEHPFPFQQ